MNHPTSEMRTPAGGPPVALSVLVSLNTTATHRAKAQLKEPLRWIGCREEQQSLAGLRQTGKKLSNHPAERRGLQGRLDMVQL